ncbi:hypothetical protein [Lentzea flava]|uniref:hypothetical protein n=1 Tax=Lentzea flava TaxID=103732 RepID=UPI00166FC99E|nr:hypothetical protein [Lentzea flava]
MGVEAGSTATEALHRPRHTAVQIQVHALPAAGVATCAPLFRFSSTTSTPLATSLPSMRWSEFRSSPSTIV